MTLLKKLGKRLLCSLLESQVRRLRAKHKFNIIAVVGSVGKTSTKLAIAHTLEQSRRVIYQTGNYNDRLTVPLVLFGHVQPGLFNIPAWLRVLIRNEQAIRRPYFYDVAVLELGVDGPGQMKDFAYLKPDIAVVTAITPEHMEYFRTLDAVAQEELLVTSFSKLSLINVDDTDEKYLPQQMYSYGIVKPATYSASQHQLHGLAGADSVIQLPNRQPMRVHTNLLGVTGIKIMLAAASVADMLHCTDTQIEHGLAEIRPIPGRMQVLNGVNQSVLIDDTYNASPAAVRAGLDTLYAEDADQRIAILGTMNELGDYSQAAHKEVGTYCDPAKLALIVTLGTDAEKYLAPAAQTRGCQVICFASPYQAGRYVRQYIKPGAVVLGEGSQNGVFAEEAIKQLLLKPEDAQRLVRQSDYWMKLKRKQFSDAAPVQLGGSSNQP